MTQHPEPPITFDLLPMTSEKQERWLKEFAASNEKGKQNMMAALRETVAQVEKLATGRACRGVSLYETPLNNHGCKGSIVTLVIINKRTALVSSGSSCSSCWQVGHDNADSPIEIGTIVTLPAWCDSWGEASAPHGRSHNELVDDSDECPQSDCSFVRPSELIY